MARKRGAGVVNTQRDLRMAAQLYGFSQDIVLYGEERVAAARDDGAADPTAGRTGGAGTARRTHTGRA